MNAHESHGVEDHVGAPKVPCEHAALAESLKAELATERRALGLGQLVVGAIIMAAIYASAMFITRRPWMTTVPILSVSAQPFVRFALCTYVQKRARRRRAPIVTALLADAGPGDAGALATTFLASRATDPAAGEKEDELTQGLIAVLKRLRASDRDVVSSDDLKSLFRLVTEAKVDLAVAAAEALAQLAPRELLPKIRRLIDNPPAAAMRELDTWRWRTLKERIPGSELDRMLTALEACRDAMGTSEDEARHRTTLLRPAAGETGAHLMRPAGTALPGREQLVRASEKDEA